MKYKFNLFSLTTQAYKEKLSQYQDKDLTPQLYNHQHYIQNFCLPQLIKYHKSNKLKIKLLQEHKK